MGFQIGYTRSNTKCAAIPMTAPTTADASSAHLYLLSNFTGSIADIVGTYDVYGQSLDVTLKESIQLPVNDPLLLVSAMAAVTKHLGFGLTANLTYEPPYLFARRMSTLDHLSRGRVGWNIVTGYLDSAAKAMGLSEQVEHDRRYDQADEYLEVLYKLWEGSWEEGAVIADKARRIHALPEIDYANIHIWPYNWRWISQENVGGDLTAACEKTTEYIRRHAEIARELGKPLVIEEFGYPRDSFAFEPGSPTTARGGITSCAPPW